jgi:hypothetical protein
LSSKSGRRQPKRQVPAYKKNLPAANPFWELRLPVPVEENMASSPANAENGKAKVILRRFRLV